MITKNDIKLGDKVFVVKPSINPIIDGMFVYTEEVRILNDVAINNKTPFEYCFLDCTEANNFCVQENKKAYKAYDDFFDTCEKYKL